ncbi:hypothetical protein [uncultured Campylobacter sp.]|uniref:hypothetical protein n=1 Tax=uncultured Campylobacter sp. TaxID=218934 RepID=UPI00262E0FC4|nr:hypothetical protein [uncultured Campylobacter sp.]
MKKTLLNNYELAVLHRGANEEKEKGVMIHSWPKYETNELLCDYYAWAMEGAKVDYEIVVEALKDLFQWWATYFTCGEETARAIHKEYNDELVRELTARCEAARKKNIEELEEILQIMEDTPNE